MSRPDGVGPGPARGRNHERQSVGGGGGRGHRRRDVHRGHGGNAQPLPDMDGDLLRGPGPRLGAPRARDEPRVHSPGQGRAAPPRDRPTLLGNPAGSARNDTPAPGRVPPLRRRASAERELLRGLRIAGRSRNLMIAISRRARDSSDTCARPCVLRGPWRCPVAGHPWIPMKNGAEAASDDTPSPSPSRSSPSGDSAQRVGGAA